MGAEWRVEGRAADGTPVALIPSRSSLPDGAGQVLALAVHRDGDLVVREWSFGAVADGARVDPAGTLWVRGRTFGAAADQIRLTARSLRSVTTGQPVPVENGHFEVSVDLRHEVHRFGLWPLPVGDHDLSVDLITGAETHTLPLKVAHELSNALPVPVLTDELEGRVVRGPDTVVRLSLRRPIGDARGPYQQRRLREQPPTESRITSGAGGLTRGILFRSYFGETATDNGLSIQRELQRRGADLPVYWAVQDRSVVVPEGGIPVVVNSREWYALLASVKYYVDNMYQPEFHQKPAGQVMVQTFHGYPFKQMGHPHWRNVQFSQARIDAYDARAREWDYLVSPARYATPLLVRDFAYPARCSRSAIPATTSCTRPRRTRSGEAVRADLGIAQHQSAVLYAPTFRDYLAIDDNKARMPDFFDFERASRAAR